MPITGGVFSVTYNFVNDQASNIPAQAARFDQNFADCTAAFNTLLPTSLPVNPANGQVPIGNGTGYTIATLTAGSGITISNAAGGITIASTASGGTVTSVQMSGGTTGLTFSGGPITGAGTITTGGTLAIANGGTGATSFASVTEARAGSASKVVGADTLASMQAFQTLTDAATISWDMSLGFNAKVTLGGARTLSVSNPKEGWVYSLLVYQDGTGSRTVTWPASFNWGAIGAPTLTTTASKHDVVTIICTNATTPTFDAFIGGKSF